MSIETTYLPGDEPEDEGSTHVYLDDLDQRGQHVVLACPAPVTLGVPVDFEKHRDAFKRDWTHKNWGHIGMQHGYVPPKVAPPLVPCRNADEREIPDAAFALGVTAFEAGAHVSVTYAQAGDVRVLKQSGVCGYCSTTTTVNADGSLKAHNKPSRGKCDGVGQPPVQVDGARGQCESCAKVAKLTKGGVMPSHTWPSEKCDGTQGQEDSIPPRLLPPETLPPIITVALRIAWESDRWAVAVWADGDYETGWVCKESTWTDPATKETIMIGRGAQNVGITAFTQYVENAGR